MKRPRLVATSGLAGALLTLTFGAALASSGASAAPAAAGGKFAVTVTNLTPGQVFSPVLVATHRDSISMFTTGQAASAELAALAEDGDNVPLSMLLTTDSAVSDVQSGTGMIPPGASETIVVNARGGARFVSLAGMLVTTNDTFVGLDTFPLPNGRDAVVEAAAYDAGSEFNSELCMYVPGPPCGSGGVHDPTPPEGFVHVSNGIHGQGDIAPEYADWRNPVAKVEIRRMP